MNTYIELSFYTDYTLMQKYTYIYAVLHVTIPKTKILNNTYVF